MAVRFGIIGSGYISRGYAAGLKIGQVPDGELVAIAGGRRAPALAEEFGAAVEPSVDALIEREDVDAVIVGSPHSAHLPQTLAAARARKHVYTEKPMAVSLSECDQMIAACRAAGVKLAVNKVLRFRDAPMAAKKLIDDGAIGEVRMIQSRGSWTEFLLNDILDPDTGKLIIPAKPWALDPKEGSQFLDWGVHANDIIRWYTGSEAALCFARYRTFGTPPPEDLTAMVSYEMANGVLAQVMMTYELPEPGISPADVTFIIGSKGMIDCDQYGKVRYTTGGEWKLYREQPAFDFLHDYLDPNRLLGFSAQVQDFARAILDDREPAVTGWDGRQAVEMANAADESARTGESVRIASAAVPA